jgi:hypothetical protein
MNYLNYTVVNGAVTPGSSVTINPNCIFEACGNIWSIDGPTLGFLCSIVVTFVNKSVGRVSYDPRILNGLASNVNLTNWGTAIIQPDGRYVISI